MGDFAKSIFFPAEFLADAELLKFQPLLAKLGFKHWTAYCSKFNVKKSDYDRFPPVFINKAIFWGCSHYDKNGNLWCYGCKYYKAHDDSEDKNLSSTDVLRLYVLFKLKVYLKRITELPTWRIRQIAKALRVM